MCFWGIFGQRRRGLSFCVSQNRKLALLSTPFFKRLNFFFKAPITSGNGPRHFFEGDSGVSEAGEAESMWRGVVQSIAIVRVFLKTRTLTRTSIIPYGTKTGSAG